MTDQPDYKSTVFLPVTDFPMKAGLAQKEPAIAARWAAMDLYGKLREKRAGRERFILHDGPPYANGNIQSSGEVAVELDGVEDCPKGNDAAVI